MRDAIADFQYAISCETVIERDPAKGESFRCTRTFEIFIQRSLRQCIGTRPAITGYNEGRQIILVTEPVYHIQVNQFILRCDCWLARLSWGDRSCGRTCW